MVCVRGHLPTQEGTSKFCGAEASITWGPLQENEPRGAALVACVPDPRGLWLHYVLLRTRPQLTISRIWKEDWKNVSHEQSYKNDPVLST